MSDDKFDLTWHETSIENPLLFLKGIQHKELEAIVKFIYIGTTEISQEDLNNFMKAAADLEVEGLKEYKSHEESHEDVVNYEELNTNEDSYYQHETKHKQFDLAVYENTNDSSNVLPNFRTGHLERNENGSYSCDECEYKTVNTDHLKRHILGKHEGVKFKCDQCPREFTTKTNLQTHVHSKHEGKKYSCEQCSIEFTHPSSLSKHKTKYHKYL